MTNKEAVNWIINLTADIGKIQHQDLWHYEQALSEIREMLEAEPARPTGRWIGEKGGIVLVKNGYTEKSCSCSECGEWLVGSDEYACCGNYCPNCGSPMEVEQRDYERASDMRDYCERYEPTYNPEDGSM